MRGLSRRSRPDQNKHSGLHGEEIHEVERRTAPRAIIVHEAIRREGEGELKRSSSALAWSGFAAGLSMGFSLVTEGLLRQHLPKADWIPLITKFGYSIGFLIVILGRQQLFTENTLTPVLSLLHWRKLSILKQVGRLWLVVLAANLAGAFLFAFILARTNVFPPEVQTTFAALGHETLGKHFSSCFISAVFAGWLIALTIWLLPFAETARVMIIIIITYIIGLGGFSHIIAGSVEVFFLVAQGELSLGDYFVRFFTPTFLGNVLGGISLVAAVNHAQVVAGGDLEK